MVRIILSLVLTLEALLGPSLCCCSFSHFARVCTKKTSEEEGQTSKAPPCCCCCVKENEPGDSSKKGAPSPLNSCPCHQDDTKSVAAIFSSTASADLSQRFFVNPLASQHLLLQGLLVLSSGHRGLVPIFSPFLSAQDLLDVHHLMRC